MSHKYGSYEYGKEWRDTNAERLAAERKVKYHTIMKPRYLRRRRWLNTYKKLRGCDSCGYNEHAVALDFDHIEPIQKKFNISHRLCNATLKSLFREIRKCRLLCANCHRVKTLEEREFYGTTVAGRPIPK